MKSELKSLLATIGAVLKGAVTDRRLLTDDSTVKARLTLCSGCEHLESKNLACKKCGCRVAYKARLLAAKCPVGKW